MGTLLDTRLTEIADAIREVEGSTDPIKASEFAERILALQVVKTQDTSENE